MHERLIMQQFIARGITLFKVSGTIYDEEEHRKYRLVYHRCNTSILQTWPSGNGLTSPLGTFLFIPRREKITDCLSSLLLPADNYSVASSQSQAVITSGLVNVTSAANNTCTQTCQTGLTTFPDVDLITSSPFTVRLLLPR